MPTECCVPLCHERGGHAFPKSNQTRYIAWKKAVRRGEKNWSPSKHAVVCKQHFDDDDYMGNTTSGTVRLQKRLKSTAIPHIFPWHDSPSESQMSRRERSFKRKLVLELSEKEMMETLETDLSLPLDPVEEIFDNEQEDNSADDSLLETETPGPVLKDQGSQCTLLRRFSATFFVTDPKGIHYYTGLETYDKFLFVLNTLGPAAYRLNYFHGVDPTLSVPDQFFLTLIKLREHMTNFALSRTFDVSESAVTNIFVTWINFMALQWGQINWWPHHDCIHYFSPSDFKAKFPTTRVILDGTEVPVKKPKDPLLQQATFSTYKNRNTAKVVVGTSPGGLVTYLSDAYGGSTSDRQILERSDLQNMCDPGDSIMVDKGFNIQDLFISSNVSINIPSFFKHKNRMSGASIMKDRKIASKRVHIERIIGLGKTYKILVSPLNSTELSLATEIIKVCFYLCNFRECIVPKNA
ncbi:PREDICTED: uncharacterized protein LOC106819344 [Priapulus caudatus]|uniref:Uncharacterized protein LOC106819344 n=1 Tax=Priapulus caudatus TaxID=37621 RepID=A0ABM1F4V3_PRICU|nr:PREDICTED: uncharacterized protein LOC106819344 [Priapulus caudatus]XP_014679475.1 PREDICTED: uncharacterized protein LOC106819344 [Priapulus caudatus]